MPATRFRFRLASVLKYRVHRRDLVRSLFAQVLAHRAALLAGRAAVESTREGEFAQMRELAGPGTVDVEGVATRRFHAGHLLADIAALQHEIDLTEQQLASCRAALTAAERDVEVLEQLRANQRREFESARERTEQRALEDAWQSARVEARVGEW